MQYRKNRKGEDISILGYGCMRFSKRGSAIDIDKAEQEVMLAIENGVNYLDTAYLYSGSEACLGRFLAGITAGRRLISPRNFLSIWSAQRMLSTSILRRS